MTNVIDSLAAGTKRDDLPEFRAGDTVKVHVKVTEGTRSRVQIFQGVVIRVQGSGVGRTFTVRKVSFGVGVLDGHVVSLGGPDQASRRSLILAALPRRLRR